MGFRDKEKLDWIRINPGASQPSSYLNHAYAEDLYNFITANINPACIENVKKI